MVSCGNGWKDWWVLPSLPLTPHHSPFVPNTQHCSLTQPFFTPQCTTLTHTLQWHTMSDKMYTIDTRASEAAKKCTSGQNIKVLHSTSRKAVYYSALYFRKCSCIASLTPSQTLLCETDKEKQTNTDTDIDTDQYSAVPYNCRWRYWYRYRDMGGGAGGSMPRYLPVLPCIVSQIFLPPLLNISSVIAMLYRPPPGNSVSYQPTNLDRVATWPQQPARNLERSSSTVDHLPP